jgi:DNA-binding CsgD family transcriptional regulator
MTVEATTALAEARLRAGDLDEAADLAETAAGLADDAEVVWLTPQPRAIAAAALAACGHEARAREQLATARRVAVAGEQQPALLWCEHGALRVADALGDAGAVISAGDRIVAAGWADVHETIAPWRASYVEALVSSGGVGVADGRDAAVQQLERAARDGDDVTTATDAARARAALDVAHGDDGAAARRFDEGLALDAAPGRPWSRARLELAAGSFHRRAGRRTRATQLLDAAERRFAAMGARRWVERARRELEACGSRPSSRRAADTPTTLTTQERVVARLVASGRSNREVAAELFISVKTVEHHVSRVFTKLGVRSRTQLAVRFAAGDTDDRSRP